VTEPISERRRREVIGALRRGTVPQNGLDVLAVGLDRFTLALDAELDTVTAGGAVFKCVRGEYGSGKTFFARWLAERVKRRGMAVAEVQISETETPLHRLETVYRRICEQLQTAEFPPSALRPVLDAWMFTLEEDVLAAGAVAESDAIGLDVAVARLLERRLSDVSRHAPAFATALRGYRGAVGAGDGPQRKGWWRGWAVSRTCRHPYAVQPGCVASWIITVHSVSYKVCSPCSATPGTPGCWWCWMRWRRCSGCAPTYARRR